jgi:2-keto-4-pentenoate hydratase/2-oxohepta-3-ene-1,7-dioic acid hydratase in catechol pathway
MKLATFLHRGATSWGAVIGDDIADVGAVLGDRLPTLRAALAAGALEELEAALPGAPRRPLAAVTWLPVIPDPGKIFCVGINYEDHRVETGRERVGHPTIFTRFADTLSGHGAAIPRPPESTEVDYEGELAVIIGRGGRRIPQAQALAHVAGYACFNDVSVRDWQRHTGQFTPGKNFPGTGPLGPWLVTADEIPDPATLRLRTRVNGAVLQDARTDQMIFTIPRIIAYCSTFTRLEPGDVIATGTPGGVGSRREPPVWLKHGDRVEVEIERVGLLVNPVADEGRA